MMPINYVCDEDNQECITMRQAKLLRNNSAFSEPSVIPVRSTVGMEYEHTFQ